jgi:hypothetical protein
MTRRTARPPRGRRSRAGAASAASPGPIWAGGPEGWAAGPAGAPTCRSRDRMPRLPALVIHHGECTDGDAFEPPVRNRDAWETHFPSCCQSENRIRYRWRERRDRPGLDDSRFGCLGLVHDDRAGSGSTSAPRAACRIARGGSGRAPPVRGRPSPASSRKALARISGFGGQRVRHPHRSLLVRRRADDALALEPAQSLRQDVRRDPGSTSCSSPKRRGPSRSDSTISRLQRSPTRSSAASRGRGSAGVPVGSGLLRHRRHGRRPAAGIGDCAP